VLCGFKNGCLYGRPFRPHLVEGSVTGLEGGCHRKPLTAVYNTYPRQGPTFLHSAPEYLNRTACPKNTTVGASGNWPTNNDDGDGLDKESLMVVRLVFGLTSAPSPSYMPRTRMRPSQACRD